MDGLTCANCNHLLREGDRFCARCSQKAETHRLTLGHLVHEFIHALTHADMGIFSLIKNLALNPGKVAREYVDGKRKKYFNPFTFALICLSVFIVINSIFHVIEINVKPDPNVLAALPSEEAKQNYLKLIGRLTQITGFITQRSNIIYMVAIPFYSFIMWLFFKRRSFAEHLVASIYFNAFLALFTSIILAPIFAIPNFEKNEYVLILITSLFQIVYMTWAYKGFLRSDKKTPLVKLIAAILVMILSWMLLTAIASIIYVLRENTWPFIQAAMAK